jgi:hypothetical protein
MGASGSIEAEYYIDEKTGNIILVPIKTKPVLRKYGPTIPPTINPIPESHAKNHKLKLKSL